MNDPSIVLSPILKPVQHLRVPRSRNWLRPWKPNSKKSLTKTNQEQLDVVSRSMTCREQVCQEPHQLDHGQQREEILCSPKFQSSMFAWELQTPNQGQRWICSRNNWVQMPSPKLVKPALWFSPTSPWDPPWHQQVQTTQPCWVPLQQRLPDHLICKLQGPVPSDTSHGASCNSDKPISISTADSWWMALTQKNQSTAINKIMITLCWSNTEHGTNALQLKSMLNKQLFVRIHQTFKHKHAPMIWLFKSCLTGQPPTVIHHNQINNGERAKTSAPARFVQKELCRVRLILFEPLAKVSLKKTHPSAFTLSLDCGFACCWRTSMPNRALDWHGQMHWPFFMHHIHLFFQRDTVLLSSVLTRAQAQQTSKQHQTTSTNPFNWMRPPMLPQESKHKKTGCTAWMTTQQGWTKAQFSSFISQTSSWNLEPTQVEPKWKSKKKNVTWLWSQRHLGAWAPLRLMLTTSGSRPAQDHVLGQAGLFLWPHAQWVR